MYSLILLLGTLHPDKNESTTTYEITTLDSSKRATGDSVHDWFRLVDGFRRMSPFTSF